MPTRAEQFAGLSVAIVTPLHDGKVDVEKLHEQKGITITHTELEGSGHFFEDRHMDDMIGHVSSYVKRRLTETSR